MGQFKMIGTGSCCRCQQPFGGALGDCMGCIAGSCLKNLSHQTVGIAGKPVSQGQGFRLHLLQRCGLDAIETTRIAYQGGGVGGQTAIGNDATDRTFPPDQRDFDRWIVVIDPALKTGHRWTAGKPGMDDIIPCLMQDR